MSFGSGVPGYQLPQQPQQPITSEPVVRRQIRPLIRKKRTQGPGAAIETFNSDEGLSELGFDIAATIDQGEWDISLPIKVAEMAVEILSQENLNDDEKFSLLLKLFLKVLNKTMKDSFARQMYAVGAIWYLLGHPSEKSGEDESHASPATGQGGLKEAARELAEQIVEDHRHPDATMFQDLPAGTRFPYHGFQKSSEAIKKRMDGRIKKQTERAKADNAVSKNAVESILGGPRPLPEITPQNPTELPDNPG